MDPRTRVRQFLARGTADRPPFLAQATEYTARLAQCDPAALLADPALFVRSFTDSITVLGLQALLIEIPAPVATGGDPAAVLREDLHRLRATLRDQIAIVTLLPGPLTLARSLGAPPTPDTLDDLVTALITLQKYLDPTDLDALALLERVPVTDPDVPALADATAAFWNVARYYSLPSLLIAAEATPQLATVGPAAVAAWTGPTAAALLSAGATAAGQPPPPDPETPGLPPPPGPETPGLPPSPGPETPGLPPSPEPVPLPPGAFYLTPGEIPPDRPVDAIRSLIRHLSQLTTHPPSATSPGGGPGVSALTPAPAVEIQHRGRLGVVAPRPHQTGPRGHAPHPGRHRPWGLCLPSPIRRGRGHTHPRSSRGRRLRIEVAVSVWSRWAPQPPHNVSAVTEPDGASGYRGGLVLRGGQGASPCPRSTVKHQSTTQMGRAGPVGVTWPGCGHAGAGRRERASCATDRPGRRLAIHATVSPVKSRDPGSGTGIWINVDRYLALNEVPIHDERGSPGGPHQPSRQPQPRPHAAHPERARGTGFPETGPGAHAPQIEPRRETGPRLAHTQADGPLRV